MQASPFYFIMLTITDIRYKSAHIEVLLDAGEPLKLPILQAGQYRLEKGRLLDAEEYLQLREESDRYLCRQKSLDYLSVRNRTSREVGKYLAKKGFSAHLARETITGLEKAGYLDDSRYAVSYVQARLKSKVIGKNLLKKELQARGIDRETVKKTLAAPECGEAKYEEIFRLAEKKLAALEGKKNRLHKVSHFLGRRGFDYELIQKIIRRLGEEHISTEEGASDAQG